MNPRDLPKLGVISNPVSAARFGQAVNLSGKRILCLGFSEAEIDADIAIHNPASINVLTYWTGHIDAVEGKYPVTLGDITKTTVFDSGHFDVVLTVSVLEHVQELAPAFDEIARITRYGGDIMHIFGPAWSCPYGHHIYQDAGDPNLCFVLWQMPAHMHLLCSRREIDQYYWSLGYGPQGGQLFWHWSHEADHINRLFFDDYRAEFARHCVVASELMCNELPKVHLAQLRARFPGKSDFSSYGGFFHIKNW